MSKGKYITMITTANKTLEKKCATLKDENIMLRRQNEDLKQHLNDLELRNSYLERSKCKNQLLCSQLSTSMLPMGYILDSLTSLRRKLDESL